MPVIGKSVLQQILRNFTDNENATVRLVIHLTVVEKIRSGPKRCTSQQTDRHCIRKATGLPWLKYKWPWGRTRKFQFSGKHLILTETNNIGIKASEIATAASPDRVCFAWSYNFPCSPNLVFAWFSIIICFIFNLYFLLKQYWCPWWSYNNCWCLFEQSLRNDPHIGATHFSLLILYHSPECGVDLLLTAEPQGCFPLPLHAWHWFSFTCCPVTAR